MSDDPQQASIDPQLPPVDAALAELIRSVMRDHGPSATGLDLVAGMVERWDPSIRPLAGTVLRDHAESLRRMADPGPDDEQLLGPLRALLATDLVARAQGEAAYMGSSTTTQRHVVIASVGLMPRANVKDIRQIVARIEEAEAPDDGMPRGWVRTVRPGDPQPTLPTDAELAELREQMRQLAEERGIEEPLEIEEGELHYVVGIGQIREVDGIRLQLTALEVRTTVAWLTWRLWIEGAQDPESPRISVEDDLATRYRTESGDREWSSDGERGAGEGQTIIVPAPPADARSLTVRLDGFELDPFERRFPGARARSVREPLEVTIELPG